MGIFDIVELKQHVRSLGEYVLYFSDVLAQKENYPKELDQISNFMCEHLKNMSKILDKFQ